MKRDRSNDGHKYSRTGGLPIRPELLASLIAEFSGPRKISAPKVYHGPKAAPGHPPVKLTDDQVLTLRKMRDWHGMSKADIARRGHELGVDYAITVSCYQADDHGRACGLCDACRLRAQGFHDAGLPDPTRYRED